MPNQSKHTPEFRLVLAFDPEAPRDAVEAARACSHVWPRGAAPVAVDEIELIAFEDDEADTKSVSPSQARRSAKPVLVILGRTGGDAHAIKAADVLRRTGTPAVFLVDPERLADPTDRLIGRVLARDGVPALPWSSAPEEIAAAMASLIARQPAIERLNQEARLHAVSSRRMQAEIEELHRELKEAARMQTEFVQRPLTEIEGLGLGVVFRPATYVSGDVFDVEALDDRFVSIFLADAVGHGVPAAMLTLYISRALRKIDGAGGPGGGFRVVPPGEALARLNHDFAARPGRGDRFATAVYALYDRQTHTISIAGAGHPPPLLVHPDGCAERIETDGPLLGVFPDGDFSTKRVQLPEGSSLVLYTDGFETAFPDRSASNHQLRLPTRTHIERLIELGRNCAEMPSLRQPITAFENLLDNQAGSLHQADDMTALVITPRKNAETVAGRRAA